MAPMPPLTHLAYNPMKNYKLYIAAGLFTASIGFAPVSAHAATLTGNDILTTAVATTEVVAWSVKSVFTKKAEFQKNIEVDGEATFNEDTFFDKLFKMKKLKVTGDATLGNAPDDIITIEGKIKRTLGKVYVNDNLRVTGDFDLDTASINSDEIANETLLSKDFMDGKIQGKDLKDGTITAGKLADTYQDEFIRTIVVSAAGTDSENGTALKAAVDGISDASASKPYLVFIEPGTYDLGTSSLTMQEYVDIEGSGEGVTTIKSATFLSSTGVIIGADNTELRNLTIDGDSVGSFMIGYYLTAGAPVISDVTCTATGGSIGSTCFDIQGGSPILRHISIDMDDSSGGVQKPVHLASGASASLIKSSIRSVNAANSWGMSNSGGTANVYDSTFVVTGTGGPKGFYGTSGTYNIYNTSLDVSGGSGRSGVYITGGTMTVNIDRSTIASTGNVFTLQTASTLNVGASQLEGSISNTGSATITCVGAYDESFAALNTSCQ